MQCLRCKEKNFFKAKPVPLIACHEAHDSHLLADCMICLKCGHVEAVLPIEQLEQQKEYFMREGYQLKGIINN